MSLEYNENFLRTMIETLKYDETYINADELITVLRNSSVRFSTTNVFTSKSWQCYENVEIRVPVYLLKKTKDLKKILDTLVYNIYEETESYDIGEILIKPKIIESEIEEIKKHEIYFEKIKSELLQSIRNANYTIWIAVAWFTDEDILMELRKKKEKGLNIRIIVSKEYQNEEMIQKLKNENFDYKVIPKFGYKEWNRLHGKYCIIDFEIVLHGSYNWTPTASYNKETLTVSLDKDFVKKFSDNFLELYNE